MRRIDFQRPRELHSGGLIILRLDGTAAAFKVVEGGGESRLFVFEPVFDVVRILIQRRFVLRHGGFEIFPDFGFRSTLIGLAGCTTSASAYGYNGNKD